MPLVATAPSQAQTDEVTRVPEWALALSLGVGHAASSLPRRGGTTGVRSAAFPAAGIELGLRLPLSAALAFSVDARYASSVGYEIERRILSGATESAAARRQEIGGGAGVEIEPFRIPLALCAALGYAARAFTTDTPLVSPATYLLSGPYALAGARWRLFGQRIALSVFGEIGAVLTASRALDNAGAEGAGRSYAASAALSFGLNAHWKLALRYRLARASLSLRDGGVFHDDYGLLLASVGWRG